jgi:hypothetical protein
MLNGPATTPRPPVESTHAPPKSTRCTHMSPRSLFLNSNSPITAPPPPPFFLLLSPDKRRRNEPNPQSGFNVQQMPPKCANSRRLTPDHHHTCAGASQQCNKTKRRQLQRLTDRMLANIACVNSKCVKRQDRPGRSCKRTRDFTKVCCIFVNGSAIKVTDGKKKKRKRKRGGCTCTKHC